MMSDSLPEREKILDVERQEKLSLKLDESMEEVKIMPRLCDRDSGSLPRFRADRSAGAT